MLHNYSSVQVWEALEVLFPNDIEMLVVQCNREFDWDYYKDINDILDTLSDDAFINEVEVMFGIDDIKRLENWLNIEYNS